MIFSICGDECKKHIANIASMVSLMIKAPFLSICISNPNEWENDVCCLKNKGRLIKNR